MGFGCVYVLDVCFWILLTFWCFAIDHTKPSAVFFAFTRFNDKAAFDDGTKNARFIRPKPFRFAQFLHRYWTTKWFDIIVVGVIICEMMIWCPPFNLANNSIGTRAWLLIHLIDTIKLFLTWNVYNLILQYWSSDNQSQQQYNESKKLFVSSICLVRSLVSFASFRFILLIYFVSFFLYIKHTKNKTLIWLNSL